MYDAVKDENKDERPKSMSISAVLMSSDPPSPKPADAQRAVSTLPSIAESQQTGAAKPNSFVSSSNNGQQYTLPPVQFDPAMDQRKQNIEAPTKSASPPVRAEDAITKLKNNGQTLSQDKKGHHHHHHHRHHHHHHDTMHGDLTREGSVPQTIHHLDPIVNNTDVFDAVKHFPSKRLNSIIYHEVQDDKVLLPRLDDKINCTLEVRIPGRYLRRSNLAVSERKVWGTDIYTDDSDLIAILYHIGVLKYDEDEAKDTKDIFVVLHILPALEIYHGSYRHGYNSRSWLTPHDGVSIFVKDSRVVAYGRAEQVATRKKQRVEQWMEMRQNAVESYPKFVFDNERVAVFREKYKSRSVETASS